MEYKKIISDSWRYTQENKGLIYWFGFFPSLLTMTVGIGYLAYQFFAFKKSFLFDNADTSFMRDVINFGWNFISGHATLTVPLVVTGIIIAVLWILIPTLTKASAIQAIARSKNGQKSGVGVGIKYGLMAFLPLFEFHLLVKTFAPMSMVTEMGFVVRNLGTGIFYALLPVFLLIMVISFILVLLFTFADLYIVIDDEGVLSSMKKSAKLVVLNWQQTFLITVLMILIGLRIIVQAVLVFVVPMAVIFTAGYLATIALETTVLIVAGVVGVLGLVLSAYLGGIVDIFSYTVWTYAFLELTSEGEISARDSARVAHGGEAPTAPLAEMPEVPEVPEPEAAPVSEPGSSAPGPSAPQPKEPSSLPPDISGSADSIPGVL